MYILTIENYIREFEMSKSRRPIYWQLLPATGSVVPTKGTKRMNSKTLMKESKGIAKVSTEWWWIKKNLAWGIFTGKKLKHKIPPEHFHLWCQDGEDKAFDYNRYVGVTSGEMTKIQRKSAKVFLIDKHTNERVLVNPKAAGTPKMQTISGQLIYMGAPFVRAKMMSAIKESYVDDIREQMPRIKGTFDVVLRIYLPLTDKWHIEPNWDIGNHGLPYLKGMLDLLVTGRTSKDDFPLSWRLEEDNILHITAEAYQYIPIEDHQTPRLEFVFKPVTRIDRNKFPIYNHQNKI